MRLVRAAHGDQVIFGRVEGSDVVVLGTERADPGADVLRDLLAVKADLAADGPRLRLADVRVLAPVANPEKIICVGLNYAEHVREVGERTYETPVFFNKMPNAVIGDEDEVILRPGASDQLDYEAELVAVIGKAAQDVTEEEALSVVLGYTAGNDISARDVQFSDGQWFRGKSMDTFGPIGPWIVTSDDLLNPQDLPILCRVNGSVLQDSNTKFMIHPVASLVAYASKFFSLAPGDLIFTGTPDGVGFTRNPPIVLRDGDTVEVEIGSIGVLTNKVRYQ